MVWPLPSQCSLSTAEENEIWTALPENKPVDNTIMLDTSAQALAEKPEVLQTSEGRETGVYKQTELALKSLAVWEPSLKDEES